MYKFFEKDVIIYLTSSGTRFANSIATLKCKEADLTWKVGLDVLCFGATKNGAMCAVAIIFFNHEYAKNFEYRKNKSRTANV